MQHDRSWIRRRPCGYNAVRGDHPDSGLAGSLQGFFVSEAVTRARSLLAKAFGLGVLVLPGVLNAQYYDDPGLDSRPVVAHPQDYKPLGIRAGSFMLHPGTQLAVEYTDNVFYTENNQESDTVFHVRPYLTAQSTWSKHSLNVSAAADVARYADFGFRDYEDYFLGVSGRVDVLSRSYFSYGLDYMNLHEDLNTRDAEQGLEPTDYRLTGGNVGYDHSFNRLSLGANYAHQELDYSNAVAADGEVIDNQDRDRQTDSLTLRAGYQFQTDKQLFVTYRGYSVDYDQPFDRSGLNRGGDGYSVDTGIVFTITGKLNGDAFVSYHDRQYDAAELPDLDGWAAGAGLQWNPTLLTAVYANIRSSVEDTTNANNSGYLQTVYSLRVDHELKRNLQLNLFASYRDYDYEQIAGAPPDARSRDKVYRYGVGANWFINRFMYLNASYGYEELETNVPGDDYDVNRVWLVFGLER
jgi:hypothetical protein